VRTDVEMRECVVRRLRDEMDVSLNDANNKEEYARCNPNAWLYNEPGRLGWFDHIADRRRQAVHFQQAIDLLIAAPMPEVKP
jgi:hypothetical protein